MSKVLFSIQYEIFPEKREEFLKVIRELKNILKADGLESYNVFEVKGKPNSFQEQYTFTSMETYEAFDDETNEQANILIDKINEMAVDKSTKYTTLVEIANEL
jgi:quinol monooxygenase YgiN